MFQHNVNYIFNQHKLRFKNKSLSISVHRTKSVSSHKVSSLSQLSKAHLFSTPVATRSHPQTGKCPTNLPQIKNVMLRVNTLGNAGIGLSHFHRKVLHSSQTSRPNTSTPSFKRLGSLLIKPKDCSFIWTTSADIMSSLTYMLST